MFHGHVQAPNGSSSPPFSLAVLRIDALLPVSSRLWSLIRSPLTGSRMLWQLAMSQAPRRQTNSIISPFFVPPLFFAGDFFLSRHFDCPFNLQTIGVTGPPDGSKLRSPGTPQISLSKLMSMRHIRLSLQLSESGR